VSRVTESGARAKRRRDSRRSVLRRSRNSRARQPRERASAQKIREERFSEAAAPRGVQLRNAVSLKRRSNNVLAKLSKVKGSSYQPRNRKPGLKRRKISIYLLVNGLSLRQNIYTLANR
jgi:hypothetical protein